MAYGFMTKNKLMQIGKSVAAFPIDGQPIKVVRGFCYPGIYLSSNSSYDKEIGLGKSNATIRRLHNIWANKG